MIFDACRYRKLALSITLARTSRQMLRRSLKRSVKLMMCQVMVSLNYQKCLSQYVCLFIYKNRQAIYNQFGEEGLKGGVPDGICGFTQGYTFHSDHFKVFSTFFGGNNPFAGNYVKISYSFQFYLLIFWTTEFFNGSDNDMLYFGGISGWSQPKKDPPITKDLFLTQVALRRWRYLAG